MLAIPDDQETDTGPRDNKRGTERLCVATRTVRPIAELIRFVIGPDGAVVPDLKRKLPGRGVWVTATRAAVEDAVRRNAFSRSLKTKVQVAPDLAARRARVRVRSSGRRNRRVRSAQPGCSPPPDRHRAAARRSGWALPRSRLR